MLLCLGEPPRKFLWCCCSFLIFILLLYLHFVVVLRLSFFFIHIFFSMSSLTLPWTIPPGFYSHFILSAQRIAEWFVTLSYSTIALSSCREGYGLEWAFFTHRHLFPLLSFTDILTCVLRYRWVFPYSLQGLILILETQARPIYLFDS